MRLVVVVGKKLHDLRFNLKKIVLTLKLYLCRFNERKTTNIILTYESSVLVFVLQRSSVNTLKIVLIRVGNVYIVE